MDTSNEPYDDAPLSYYVLSRSMDDDKVDAQLTAFVYEPEDGDTHDDAESYFEMIHPDRVVVHVAHADSEQAAYDEYYQFAGHYS